MYLHLLWVFAGVAKATIYMGSRRIPYFYPSRKAAVGSGKWKPPSKKEQEEGENPKGQRKPEALY
jgi:hypothetical protein